MPTRRTFISLALGAPLAGCGLVADESFVDNGVLAATFEVGTRGALIWVLSDESTELSLELVDMSTGTSTVRSLGEAAAGQSATVELQGLSAATSYTYRIHTADAPTRRFHFRTSPTNDARAALHLAVSADIDPAFELGGLDTVALTGPDLYVNLGDWPYADEPTGARTLDEYRERHLAVRRPSAIQSFLARVPVRGIYDDHEVWCNWDGGFRDAQPGQLAAALTAWDEFFPLDETDRRYRSWRHGTVAEMFLLDTRLYRSPNESEDGPDKTMLGAEQLAWLRSGLAASDATFKIIFSSVPLAFATGFDHWSAFVDERDQLLAFIDTTPVANTVFISADRHYFEAHHFASGLREFHVGPLAAGPGAPPETSPAEVVETINAANFGEIVVEPGPPDTLAFIARDVRGGELYRETIIAD